MPATSNLCPGHFTAGVSRRLPRGSRAERALLLTVLVALCSGIACDKDNFVCGVPTSSGSMMARYCSGANQTCICATTRCAAPDAMMCPSGLRYVYGDKKCVDATAVASQLTSNDQHTFCPGQVSLPPPCGIAADGGFAACGAGQMCLCAEARGTPAESKVQSNVCVKPSATCDGGLARAFDGVCAASGPSPILRPPSDPACPGSEFPGHCGLPQSGDASCPAGFACLCGVAGSPSAQLNIPNHTCVTASDQCSGDGGTGLADKFGRCLSPPPNAGQLTLTFGDAWACPGNDINGFRDAGTDARADAPDAPADIPDDVDSDAGGGQ